MPPINHAALYRAPHPTNKARRERCHRCPERRGILLPFAQPGSAVWMLKEARSAPPPVLSLPLCHLGKRQSPKYPVISPRTSNPGPLIPKSLLKGHLASPFFSDTVECSPACPQTPDPPGPKCCHYRCGLSHSVYPGPKSNPGSSTCSANTPPNITAIHRLGLDFSFEALVHL